MLTALGGQQAVDWIHQQNELAETREALREEIAQNSALLAVGAATDRCRLALYEKYVDWARGGPQPERAPTLGVPTLIFSAWEVAKAGPLSKMPVRERLSYSQVYQHLVAQQANIAREVEGGLAFAQYFGLEQLNPDQAQRVLELNGAARILVAGKDRVASDFLNDVQTLGIPPEPVSESRRQLLNAICQAAGMPTPAL